MREPIALPPAWQRQGYRLRPARARDRSFQRAVFAAARSDSAQIALWPSARRDAFLRQQYDLQDIHYRRFFAGAVTFIICRHHEAIGRIILQRAQREWRLIDIGLLPDRRRQGLGTALIRALQETCVAAGAQRLILQVETGNAARGLYDRLGFCQTGDMGSHIEMAWSPAAQLKTAS